MNLMIIEPRASGHHLRYLSYIVASAQARKWRVQLVTSKRASDSAGFDQIASLNKDEEWVKPILGTDELTGSEALELARKQFGYWFALARAYRRLADTFRPDCIYVSNFDFCDKSMALLGSPFKRTSFVGLLMRTGFHHKDIGLIGSGRRYQWISSVSLLKLQGIRSLRSILTIDPHLPRWSLSKGGKPDKVVYVPDPVPRPLPFDRTEARKFWNFEETEIVIVVFGSLSVRKGIRELLMAINSPECPQTCTVFLAGRQSDEVRQIVQSTVFSELAQGCRLRVYDQFLNAREESAALTSADIIWVGYLNFAESSGVLLQAASVKVPVIGCAEGLIGETIREFGIGVAVDPRNKTEVLDAIRVFSDRKSVSGALLARFTRLTDEHSIERFANGVCEQLAVASRQK